MKKIMKGEALNAQEATRNRVKINKLINFDINSGYKIKVSVVVPVYNVQLYLRECLDSIVNQTLKEIEIICVNDGSTDNSEAILEEYAKKDSRVKIIDKENAGYGHAVNIGMDMASGKYIGIVESDDYIDAHMYEELYNAAKKNKVDFVKCDFNKFIDVNDEREYSYVRSAEKDYYNKIINAKKDKSVFKFNVHTWTGLYQKDFIIKNNIRHNETPGASFQDNGFYFKTFCNAEKIMFVDRGYYYYRFDNPDSSIHSSGNADAIIREFDYISDYAKKQKLSDDCIQLYYWKRYQSFLYTLERIDEDSKKDFFYFFAKDLKDIISSGKAKRETFGDDERDTIAWIISDPDGYYNIRVKRQKISVIIPVDDSGKHIEECLASVTGQTLKEIEIICVIDGSAGKSWPELSELKKSDRRICVRKQLNSGAGEVFNRSIGMAHGEFVAFMDQNDFYPSDDVLKTLYANAKKYNVNISGGSLDYIGGNVAVNRKGIKAGCVFEEDGLYNYRDYRQGADVRSFIYNTQMIRENKIYFPKAKKFCGAPFFTKAMLCAGKFYGTAKAVYCSRGDSAADVTDGFSNTPYDEGDRGNIPDPTVHKFIRFVTWLPRKIRNAATCLIKNGAVYTLIRIFKGRKAAEEYSEKKNKK